MCVGCEEKLTTEKKKNGSEKVKYLKYSSSRNVKVNSSLLTPLVTLFLGFKYGFMVGVRGFEPPTT